ncbi:hypothetical protein JAAARDRAFT_132540, partial [Jaapia argillacea MUCL 33604]
LPVKHDRFYFADGSIVFLVNNTLYKIHRYFLQRDSDVLSERINWDALTGGGALSDGSAEYHSLQLENINAIEFDRFLSTLYPFYVNRPFRRFDEWTSVLRLASMWNFALIRELAIEQPSEVASPVDKVVLGRQYTVTQWLVPAFVDLAKRDTPLNLGEGRRLGMEDAILLGQIVESRRYTGWSRNHEVVEEDVQRLLGEGKE